MSRSELTIDLGALRRNVGTLRRALDGAALWAVVKADGYGHGAVDVSRAALDAGAETLCVATVPEALELRREFLDARILCMGPLSTDREITDAREASIEIAVAGNEIPEGLRVHLKLETGMGRFGLSEVVAPTRHVVGLMSHLATADTDTAFAQEQVACFAELVQPHRGELACHIANSAAALRLPEARFDAARCGIAIYGLSPFVEDLTPELEPVLRWESQLAQVKLLQAGQSTGYGRSFVAEQPTWIGLVPVGYADGFRRDLTGTEVRVGGELRKVVGTISMDSFAVELDREVPVGTPVTLLGDGVLAEHHARVAGTINYELVTGISSDPRRADRIVVGL